MPVTQSLTHLKSFGIGLSFGRLPKTFAENFRALQDRSQKTGRAIAQATGITESEISEYRTGSGGTPEATRLLRLATALECSVDELLEGIDPNYDSKRRDLIWQTKDQSSGSSSHVGDPIDDPASTRMELERLRNIVARYDQEVRKMRTLADDVFQTAIALEEVRVAGEETPARRRHDRKTG